MSTKIGVPARPKPQVTAQNAPDAVFDATAPVGTTATVRTTPDATTAAPAATPPEMRAAEISTTAEPELDIPAIVATKPDSALVTAKLAPKIALASPSATFNSPAVPLRYPPQVEDRRDPRNLVIGAIVALVVMAVIGAILLANSGSRDAATDSTGGDTTDKTQPTNSPSNGPQTGQTDPTTRGPGINSKVSFGAQGAITVSQHVAFSGPTSHLTLSMPAGGITIAGGVFAPTIDNIAVITPDGTSTSIEQTIEPGGSLDVPLPDGSLGATIVYVAYSAVQHVDPAPPGNLIALINPINIDAADGLSTTINVIGTDVTNLGCGTQSSSTTACGHQATGAGQPGWSVERSAADANLPVIAQLVR